MGSIFRFAIGLIILIAIVAGAYYYTTIKTPQQAVQEQQTGAAASVQVQTGKYIPPGAVMEDGTIGQ